MPDLPARPDLHQLRIQAKDLIKRARAGDAAAAARINVVSERLTLAAAQLALAREYGFASWARLKAEVKRRAFLDNRDIRSLRALFAEQPQLAREKLEHWSDHPLGATPLGYVAMLRFDAPRLGLPGEISGTAEVARLLIGAGAPVEGAPDDCETPLITAASYGDADVARVLIEAGADIEAVAAENGAVPGCTALMHAAVFGNTNVVDVLVAAGARIGGIVQAAAAGELSGHLTPETPLADRLRALATAAAHGRLGVIDDLIAAGTPVDVPDDHGRLPLAEAIEHRREEAADRLRAAGAE
jgi:hypothetical protein